MASIFDKWDQNIDVEGLQHDIDDAAKNGGNFKEVPVGRYEVGVEKMELVASKKGDPMCSIWFKVKAGDFKGSLIFYNQMLTSGTGIHFNNQMLRDMDLDCIHAIEDKGGKLFQSYNQYSNLLLDAHEEIEAAGLTFDLDYSDAKREGFLNYKIKDVFEN